MKNQVTASPNTLPGGFSVVTTITRTAEVSKANDLAALLRGIANIARLDRLMRITEGRISHDARAGFGRGKIR